MVIWLLESLENIYFIKPVRFLEHVGKEALIQDNDEGAAAAVTVCDINASMLKVGESRAAKLGHNNGISWVEGDAQELPFEACWKVHK